MTHSGTMALARSYVIAFVAGVTLSSIAIISGKGTHSRVAALMYLAVFVLGPVVACVWVPARLFLSTPSCRTIALVGAGVLLGLVAIFVASILSSSIVALWDGYQHQHR